MQNEQDKLREIQVIAQKKYPGRGLADLTDQEKASIFQDYESLRAQAAQNLNSRYQGTQAGNVFVSNPWSALGSVARQGAGAYQMYAANKGEREGRQTLADMQTRRDALDTEREETLWERNRKREEDFWTRILGAGI